MLIIIRAFADAYKTGKQQWFPPILFAHRARLHQRQTQCTKNRTSATSSRRNSTGRGAPSPGSPASSASRAKTPTRSSTARGSTPTCSSRFATYWTTISSSAIRITGTAGKKNEFTGFCGGVSEKVVLLQAVGRGHGMKNELIIKT